MMNYIIKEKYFTKTKKCDKDFIEDIKKLIMC